jgi:glycosyltransferase involved in cell wall biosynthesis
MHIRFDKNHISNSGHSIAMVVANGVQGDSRVIKTAASLSKMGFRVHLFGMSKSNTGETLEGYPFSVELVANPAYDLKAKGQWLDANGNRNIAVFIEALALSIAESMGSRSFDILHTHDMYGLPVGAKLKRLAFSEGIAWVHDLHEYVEGCTNIDEHIRNTMWALEKEYICEPDALTTVSPILAKLISGQYGLAEPGLVLNAPRMSDYDPWYSNPIRKALGLSKDVPLAVYNGNVKPIRGVHFVVEALGLLPELHLALLTESKGKYVDTLLDRARELGVLGRLHIHPYVPNHEVTSFLQEVNAGVNPVSLYANSDLALPNKIFEYIHSGTPIVSTATTALTGFLENNRCGVTFPEGDVPALAGALEKVIRDLPDGLPPVGKGSKLAEEHSWETQEVVLEDVYKNLLNAGRRKPADVSVRHVEPVLHLPVFGANQPGAMSRALQNLGSDSAYASLSTNKYGYPCDCEISRQNHTEKALQVYLSDPLISNNNTYHYHTRPLVYRGDFSYPTGLDLLLLKAMGKSVFFHFRGSEVRLNSVFKALSPYHYIEEQRAKNMPFVFQEPDQKAFRDFVCGVCDDVFVNDPELQCYVPNALIVPRAIDHALLEQAEVQKVRERPLIVHAPSRRGVKGTEYVLRAVELLKQEGLQFDFTLVENMSHCDALEIYRQATIIVDQLRIGWYGVLAVEGMALGKTVVSYIRHDLRHYLPSPAPLANADPNNVTEVLRYLLNNPESAQAYAQAGRKFVKEYHDADKIAELLMSIYNQPFRAIDPSATAIFLAWQKDKQSSFANGKRLAFLHPGFMRKRSGIISVKKNKLVRKTNYYGCEFIYVAKQQGIIAAIHKSVVKLFLALKRFIS